MNFLSLSTRAFGNSSEDGLIGIRNVFAASDSIVQFPSLTSLKGTLEGETAVVVSSGPSLSEAIPHLKDLEKKAVIIAADSSYQLLRRSGIRPHIVTTMERVPVVKTFFDPQIDEDDVLMVAFPIVEAEVYTRFTGKKILAYREQPLWTLFGVTPEDMAAIGPTVGNLSFLVAGILGCSRAILVGQDLSFEPDSNASHADGIPLENS